MLDNGESFSNQNIFQIRCDCYAFVMKKYSLAYLKFDKESTENLTMKKVEFICFTEAPVFATTYLVEL